jgi:glutamine amidotransferase
VRPSVTIIEGGGANIASLTFALGRLGASWELTADAERVRAARRVILPGVGAAADAMERLRAAGLDTLIPELSQPLLGICLGMQLLFESSEEDDAQCLGIVGGRAKLFKPAPGRPVPHMGWNRIKTLRETPLLDGIESGSHFYFVHSYALDVVPETVAAANYGHDFSAVVACRNFYGTQFHPERSGKSGAQLLGNFLELDTQAQ